MELKSKIDQEIQIGLSSNRITFPVDVKGKIAIYEYRMDTRAGTGMLYVLPASDLPKGELPFLVIPASHIYGVFHIDGKAAIIEVNSMALDGEIKDWYIKSQS
jgi:hypothetical protein